MQFLVFKCEAVGPLASLRREEHWPKPVSFTLAKGCLTCLCFSSPPVLFVWSLCSYVYNNFSSSTGRVMDKLIPYSLVVTSK